MKKLNLLKRLDVIHETANECADITYMKEAYVGDKRYRFELNVFSDAWSDEYTFKINNVEVLSMKSYPIITVHNIQFDGFECRKFTETNEVVRILEMFKLLFRNECYWDYIIRGSNRILKNMIRLSKRGE